MMQIPISIKHLINVIFVLSTIVAVTDCCSSRILLLREHTLKIVEHQHNFHNHLHEHAHELQQQANAFVDQWQLQQHFEAVAQEAAVALNPEPLPDTDMEVPQVDESTEAVDVGDTLSSSTGSWSTVESSSSTTTTIPADISSTTTTATTVTHTGEPPPDQSSPNPLDWSPTMPPGSEGPRKNVSEVQLLPCSEEYKANFCLNGGRCFHHPMVNSKVLHSCLCKDDYVGERCEYKNWNGGFVYVPPVEKRKVRMAHIVFSFPVLIMLSSLYVLFAAVFLLRNVPDYRQKQQQLHLRKQRFFVRC
ncbi:hypothetical protein KR018_003750 [Drosophila ironensis]|nr:hypothetical protein KR018_003750 [Drosophila ironensis]